MEKIKNVVIVTAKGGNTTVQNKNCIPVMGVPVMCYPLRAAKQATNVDSVFVSTEDKMIKSLALKEGAGIITRPVELATSTSQHKDVIVHAVKEVTQVHAEAENFVVLLGNTVQVSSGIIDRCFQMLESEECDSVATVWKAQDDHPYRAMVQDEDGFMKSFQKLEVSSNRQSYPEVFFYDQGIWAFKKHCAFEQKGPSPWVWLGEKCRMIERPWVTGRDIHSWIDISASVWYLNAIQVNDFFEFKDL
jgi:CMP-N-acetylneuraminic acid synthetase